MDIDLPWIRCSYISAVAIVLFTLGMLLIYIGYGVPIWAPLLLCCLPWVWYCLPWIRYSSACARTLALRVWAGEDGGPSPGARALICWRVGCPRGSQSRSWRLQQRWQSSRPKTGSRSRPSGRSTHLPHGTPLDQNSTSPRWTRSTAMLSRSLMSPAATRRLSLWLATPQQRSPMPYLGFTNGGHWSSPSFSRLTRGKSSWARSARCCETWSFCSTWACWYPSGPGHCRTLQPDAGWTPFRAPVYPGDAALWGREVHRVG